MTATTTSSSAPGICSGAAISGGQSYLRSGKDGSAAEDLHARTPGDTFGFDAVGMGDVDGDGTTDFRSRRRGAASTASTQAGCSSSRSGIRRLEKAARCAQLCPRPDVVQAFRLGQHRRTWKVAHYAEIKNGLAVNGAAMILPMFSGEKNSAGEGACVHLDEAVHG